MRITILTLFPEMYGDFLNTSIVGRSISRGIVSVDLVQIRDFAHDTYRHVDGHEVPACTRRDRFCADFG